MSDELHATMVLVDDKIRYSGALRDLPPIVTDYPPPAGTGQGYTSLEVFLHSLASCAGGTMGFVLRRILKKEARGIRVTARGTRRTEHPLTFRAIHLDVLVTSRDATEADVQQAFRLAEETYCPVLALVRGNVDLTATVRLDSATCPSPPAS